MANILRPVVLLLALIPLSFSLNACGGSASENPAVISGAGDVERLEIIDRVEGTGATATVGHDITVHYDGWLYDKSSPGFKGTMFDSTDGGAPFSFTLGNGEVISGWDQGLIGMKVGGRRTLIIPAELGYGRPGNGPIPPNSALVFDIELLDVSSIE